MKKLKENITLASGFSPITIDYSDYLIRFINRINEVYGGVSIKYRSQIKIS